MLLVITFFSSSFFLQLITLSFLNILGNLIPEDIMNDLIENPDSAADIFIGDNAYNVWSDIGES